MLHRRPVKWIASIALLCVVGCGGQTVPGPESGNLAERINGYLLYSPNEGSIVAVNVHDLTKTVIHPFGVPKGDHDPRIHALSGPDDEGRIAYIEDHFFVLKEGDERHLLKTVQIDGTAETTLFSRRGSAMWATSSTGEGEIGKHLALSPTGGRVAFLSGLSDKQMPQALFSRGTIEIWDINRKERLSMNTAAVDMRMSWFPDGQRLAFVRFVPRKYVPEKGISIGQFGRGDYTGTWDELPAIHVLDIRTGDTQFLSLGWIPVVSGDGKSVLVGGWVSKRTGGIDLVWKSVDAATGASTDAYWPGDAGGPIAKPLEDLVLYWGLPTSGTKIKHSSRGSFRAGLMLLTIKAADLKHHRFQTIVPEIDPRNPVSFGVVTRR